VVAGPKLNALTGLRFFAAFAIVIHHSRGTFLPVDAMSLWPLDSAVSFFFVLSGFILTHVYPELPTCKHITKFFLARVARLWPVHVVTLVLALLLFPEIMLRSGWWALGANIAALHAWIPRGDFFFSFNAVSWSISCELGFYLLFPLLINDLRSTWAWKLIPSLLAAMVLIAICTVLESSSFRRGAYWPHVNRIPLYEPARQVIRIYARHVCCSFLEKLSEDDRPNKCDCLDPNRIHKHCGADPIYCVRTHSSIRGPCSPGPRQFDELAGSYGHCGSLRAGDRGDGKRHWVDQSYPGKRSTGFPR
jgi:Acyltransferase family